MTIITNGGQIKINVTGARGESLASIARRTGAWGVDRSDSDAVALHKLAQAATQPALEALATMGPFYPDVAAGEAATVTGDTFAVAEGGGVTWHIRTIAGSDLLFQGDFGLRRDLFGTGPLVIAVAGQSNARGANSGGPNPLNPRVHSWDAVTGAFVPGGQYNALPWTRGGADGNAGNNNYGLSMAHVLQHLTGREVYLILDAVGGTPISAWVGDGTASERYTALQAKVSAALATIPGKSQIDALIWAQGEEDFQTSFAVHLAAVTALNAQLRGEAWMDATTPIYCMGMSNLHNRYEPEKALRHYCGKVNQNWTYVSMKGLPTQYDIDGTGDYTHFLGDSLWAGGVRAAWAFASRERSKEIAVLPFWGRGNGELTMADVTAIASFSHLVSWDSRDKTSLAVNSHAAVGAIAWGENCIADGNYSFALGHTVVTDNLSNYTLLAGRDISSGPDGDYCGGFGFQNAVNAPYCFMAGRGNTVNVPGASAVGLFSSPAAIGGSDLMFRVGAGTSDSARVNAFAVAANGIQSQRTLTVASLPAAGTAGRKAFVTDANAATFGSVVAGGGTNRVPVYDNGANWVIG